MGKHLKKPVSLRLDEEETRLLDRMAEKHGGKQRAIVQGLRALEGSNELTNEELISTLRARLNTAQAGKTPISVKENLQEKKIIAPPKR